MPYPASWCEVWYEHLGAPRIWNSLPLGKCSLESSFAELLAALRFRSH